MSETTSLLPDGPHTELIDRLAGAPLDRDALAAAVAAFNTQELCVRGYERQRASSIAWAIGTYLAAVESGQPEHRARVAEGRLRAADALAARLDPASGSGRIRTFMADLRRILAGES